ncbi:MAG: helix-turn-helix domain-containing protein [Beijerinckiaceae bacterium]
MTLADYLAQPGKTATDIARECGVSVSTITRAAAGGSPSLQLMRKIAAATGGKVTANDFMGKAA